MTKQPLHYSPLLVAIFCTTVVVSCASSQSSSQKRSSTWGMSSPGPEPQVFAPDVISMPNRFEFGSVVTRDGQTIYFAVENGRYSEIQSISFVGNRWGPPRSVVGRPSFSANDPFLSPDERRLYFITKVGEHYDIAFVERESIDSESWGSPQFAPAPINSDANEYYISFTKAGDLVFASDRNATTRGDFDIYVARNRGKNPALLERFGQAINGPGYEADAFIDPDERFVIFSSNRRGGRGRGDLYISFASANGWSQAISMGDSINTKGHQLCPFVTADGRFLFYTSDGDIYWVDASIIESLRGSQAVR